MTKAECESSQTHLDDKYIKTQSLKPTKIKQDPTAPVKMNIVSIQPSSGQLYHLIVTTADWR